MGKKVLLVVIILLGITRIPVFSQLTTMGTDFYLSFGNNNGQSANDVDLQIRVVAQKATTVTFSFTADITKGAIVNVAAGDVYTLRLTAEQKALVYSTTGGLSSKSLYIHSDEPVSVYALNQYQATTDATNVLPVNTLAREYYHISYQPVIGRSDGYTIVATEANTDISENGVKLTTLAKGQVYTVYRLTDMTGAHITANKPIAFFTTNAQATIPDNVGNTDILYQQMMPVRTWGKRYYVPVTRRGAERIRIVASQDNTTIEQTGGVSKTTVSGTDARFTLNKGEFVELEIKAITGGCYIAADKPVGVCSFLTGSGHLSLVEGLGDPAMAIVPPVEQFVDSATIAPFIPTGTTVLTQHGALIVTRTDTRNETTMNIGGALSSLSNANWKDGLSGYSYLDTLIVVTTNISYLNRNKAHTFANPNGLAVIGYGIGNNESYYYLAGSAVKDLSALFYVNGEEYTDVDGKRYIAGSNFHIKAVLEYVSEDPGFVEWYIDDQPRSAVTDQVEWDLLGLPLGKHTIRMRVHFLTNAYINYETTILICPPRIPVNPRY